MNLRKTILIDFINELLREQSSLANSVSGAEDKDEVLKQLESITKIIKLLYKLEKDCID